MNINSLNEKELNDLKYKIENQMKKIKDEKKRSLDEIKRKTENKLSNGKMFCINFNGDKYWKTGIVDVKFGREKDGYHHINTNSNTIGFSASVRKEQMDKHYCLKDFVSSFYFLTLKPDNWKEDLNMAMDEHIKAKRKRFNNEIKELRNKINKFSNKFKLDNF
jgi:hypothetical protein